MNQAEQAVGAAASAAGIDTSSITGAGAGGDDGMPSSSMPMGTMHSGAIIADAGTTNAGSGEGSGDTAAASGHTLADPFADDALTGTGAAAPAAGGDMSADLGMQQAAPAADMAAPAPADSGMAAADTQSFDAPAPAPEPMPAPRSRRRPPTTSRATSRASTTPAQGCTTSPTTCRPELESTTNPDRTRTHEPGA